MPIRYAVDEARRVIRTVGTGDVTPDEVASHLQELEAELPKGVRFDVVLDLDACMSLPSSEQLRMVASWLEPLGRERFDRLAIVASRDALFGMTRMFEVFVEELFEATRVFRATGEADRWLGAGR